MKVVRMEFPDKKDRDVVTLKNISSYRRFIQVVLATPSGAASLPVARRSTVRQAVSIIMRAAYDVRRYNLHILSAMARRCLPRENFQMDQLWNYEGYVGLVPWRSPFSNITGYYLRVTEVLEVVVGALFPQVLIDIITAYNTSTPFLQEQDLCETTFTHALEANIEDSTTDGSKHKPVFITMAFTAEQLYGAYPGLCPIEYKVKDAKTGRTFTTPITSYFFQENNMQLPFDYNRKHRDDTRLRYLCNQQFLRSEITIELAIGLQLVSFINCATAGFFIKQAPSIGQVLEQALRCYEAALASEGTHPSFVGDQYHHCCIWDANPLLKPRPGTVAHTIPPAKRLRARLVIHMKLETLDMDYLELPPKKMTFRSYMYQMMISCLLNTIHQGDSELKGFQVALEMANNAFLLLRHPVQARRAITKELEKELKADESDEYREFSSFIGCYDVTKAPIDQMVGCGVLTFPWLERLMELDHEYVLHIMGQQIKVVVSKYRFRTPLSVNHGSALRASKVKSLFVSDMQGSATGLPAIVQACSHAKTNPLALDYARFWQLPFDYESFHEDPHCVAAALNLELSVTVVPHPGFDVNDGIEDFLLTPQTDCSDAALYHRVEEHFHRHAAKSISNAAKGINKVKLPSLWGSDLSADQVKFYVVLNPNSMARLMSSWKCIHVSANDIITLNCARLLADNSILKDVFNALPQCPGSTLPFCETEPLQVPEATPAAILQLAIDLRIHECGCGLCRHRFWGLTWSIGSDVRHCVGPCQSVSPIRMTCFNDPDGPQVRPVEGANFDVRSLRWVQDILHCLSQSTQAYLLQCFYFSHSTGMSPLLMRLCNIECTSETTGPFSLRRKNIIPLHRRELRYNNSHVRFVWAKSQMVL